MISRLAGMPQFQNVIVKFIDKLETGAREIAPLAERARVEYAKKLKDRVETVLKEFGFSVALSGSSLVVGAPFVDVSGSNSGAAYGFDVAAAAEFTPYCTAGTSGAGCQATIAASGRASQKGSPARVMRVSRRLTFTLREDWVLAAVLGGWGASAAVSKVTSGRAGVSGAGVSGSEGGLAGVVGAVGGAEAAGGGKNPR